jgi:hypothetical protein
VARHISIGRIVAAVVSIAVLYILFQAYSQHWHVGVVIPAVISLFFFLLYLIQKLIGALWRVLAWPFGFPILIFLWWNQPYSGVNIRPLAGFMRESDRVEEMRRQIRRQQETLPAERAAATADRAIEDEPKYRMRDDGDSEISP